MQTFFRVYLKQHTSSWSISGFYSLWMFSFWHSCSIHLWVTCMVAWMHKMKMGKTDHPTFRARCKDLSQLCPGKRIRNRTRLMSMARKRYVIYSLQLPNMSLIWRLWEFSWTIAHIHYAKTHNLRNISMVFYTLLPFFNFRCWNMALGNGETELIKIPLQWLTFQMR